MLSKVTFKVVGKVHPSQPGNKFKETAIGAAKDSFPAKLKQFIALSTIRTLGLS